MESCHATGKPDETSDPSEARYVPLSRSLDRLEKTYSSRGEYSQGVAMRTTNLQRIGATIQALMVVRGGAETSPLECRVDIAVSSNVATYVALDVRSVQHTCDATTCDEITLS